MNRRRFLFGSLGMTAMGIFGLPNFALGVVPNVSLQIPKELMDNPLLDFSGLPKYSKIKPEHIKPAMMFLFEEAKKTIETVANEPDITWQNFYFPLAAIDDKIDRAWSAVSNLHAVANDDALRKAYNEARSLVSEFYTWRGMHRPLFDAVLALKNSPEYATLTTAQQKLIDDVVLEFRLSGVDLPKDKQEQLAKIDQRLSELSTQFGNNALDATNGWHRTFPTADALKGLNDAALASAKQAAEDKGESGYRIGLDIPSYMAVMTYADDADLRRTVYKAFSTKASPLADNTAWDNTPVIAEIMTLRHQKAKLLGFDNFAEYSLATKMADSPKQVMDFLTNLSVRSRPKAQAQFAELSEFAKQTYGVDKVNAWDVAYYTEKHKSALYAFDKELLREYFPEEKVLSGLFEIAKRLFGITIRRGQADVWDSSVKFYEVYDPQNRHKASFYLDMYARDNKRGGAWMSTAINRIRRIDESVQLPVAVIVTNFRRPAEGQPSLLLHDEVTTLFHEFGHAIHLMLTQMDVYGVSGLSGVPWDAVEVPSQLMEGFTFNRTTLPFISAHYQTGEPLPADLLDKVIEAKHYQGAMSLIRQLEFGIFDMRLHSDSTAQTKQHAQELYLKVNKEIGVIDLPDFVRRPNTFSHVFSGGYAAGYYSYLWSELFANDGFAKFEEEGILSPVVGKRLEDTILGQGGSRSPMALYVAYRGREPSLKALLANYGIE
ncbi:M3 family metallopeptidase [Moraxella canis]|uniref:oligopeptidase A n=1 Tax=Moraxella canis TaxID=90239 RepID=A0ABZ0WWF7_9GAMM|nr:M3 family metallopeptidase [Moraxella canis]WQE03579.1 M3 family metallopeptidase [Moraxella canis]